MSIIRDRIGCSALATLPLAFLLSLPSGTPVATAAVQLEREPPPHRTFAASIGPDAVDDSIEPATPARAGINRWIRTPPRRHTGAARPASAPAAAQEADCWLWPGAASRRCAGDARIYLLQGHFHRNGRFEAQGPLPGRGPREGRELVPVYRMDRLPANGVLQAVAAPVIDAWRRRGWQVPGVQVDFDSPTTKLDRYARWIRLENERFVRSGPGGITSVTGLGDWLVNGRPADLRALNRAAGVIAFMFYHQGRGIEPLHGYIDALAGSDLRFRLGLLPAQCCFSLSPVGSPRDLTGLFRRRIAWEDGAIREWTGAGAIAFVMNRRCTSGEDVGARASSVGKRWGSASFSRACPHAP